MPRGRQHAFHRGKLFIKDAATVIRLHPWPELWAQVRRGEGGEWECYVPEFPLVHPVRRAVKRRADEDPQMELGLGVEAAPSESDKRRIALARFRARIPRRVAGAVEQLRCQQWQLLLACQRVITLVDLVESNPALACLWVWDGRHHLPAELAYAARAPRREVLERLDLPASKSCLKFLRKVYLPVLDWEMGAALNGILRDEDSFARLRHVPRVGTGVAALARSSQVLACCAPSLIDEVAAAKDELYRAPTAVRLESHLEMVNELALPAPRPIRSRAELERQHREMVDLYNEHRRGPAKARSRDDGDFGPPPVPGSQTIQPLRSEQELADEGYRQRNCVASYAGRVRSGTHYIYRVTWPQRCTLSLVNTRGGWRLSELETAGNRGASGEAEAFVLRWLRRNERLVR